MSTCILEERRVPQKKPTQPVDLAPEPLQLALLIGEIHAVDKPSSFVQCPSSDDMSLSKGLTYEGSVLDVANERSVLDRADSVTMHTAYPFGLSFDLSAR